MQALPLERYYPAYSLNHLISKSLTNFVHNLSPFGNELIKYNPIEERDDMHEIKIMVLHKVYKQLYTPLCQDLQNKSESSQWGHYRITSK
jgi:hypothetical protein